MAEAACAQVATSVTVAAEFTLFMYVYTCFHMARCWYSYYELASYPGFPQRAITPIFPTKLFPISLYELTPLKA